MPNAMMMPVALADLPSRAALAAWLELEAALIEATPCGSEDRASLNVHAIASRPNDNEHVATARRIARMLRDPDAALPQILERVRGSRHFRVVNQQAVTRLMGEATPSSASLRKAYAAAMPLPQEGEAEFPVNPATDLEGGTACSSRSEQPTAESLIDTSDPAWMIPGGDDLCVSVRTDQGPFEVPSSSIKVPAGDAPSEGPVRLG
jgi:hypothetical protein